MHGRVQNYGGSCKSLQRISSQHMRSVLPLTTKNNTVAISGDHHHSSLASPVSATASTDSFLKDGRKISVGDCALFKPPHDCPPFIGLIRWLRLSKENHLQLGVNWLYRPAELKLSKGAPLDSAPNEIFYSFHKDETPAASLLHPCKVAFLPRGVELPTGTSSFVCRRVYDISNKCLWWLTDQNFINERQEEVDKLLHKTRTEMHATLQPDGRSPKQVDSPNSTSQLKAASDSGQNNRSFPSQVKGKKRERVDHGTDSLKRGRSLRSDGSDFHYKTESNLKSQIARITEKGGIVDLEGVNKLVQLMQSDRPERKMDLVSRSMLAGVVAATDKVDCLNHFVQLRGLPVLDEWLQDIHKGKIGDGNSSKDNDKPVEEFLLVLLRALDKLPVDLNALQMCNIGRSVNHLRSHKNLEIQRKARSLVDTWKRRVEAEMISIDAKSGSTQSVAAWSSKSRLPETSHGGSRTPSGSDVAIKSSITQSSVSKTISPRSSHGENNIKSASSSPGPVKPVSSLAPGKESHPRVSTGDAPLIREDRSSSSNQSHNYSQSSSGKEDGKCIAAGSVTASKISSVGTRNRKSSAFPTSVSGSQKETTSGRSSVAHKTTALENISHSSFSTNEKVLEGAINEAGSHKLILKMPNRIHSPAQGGDGVSLEGPACMSSRVSSPVHVDKLEQSDHTSKDKSDGLPTVASDVNVGSWQNTETKDVSTGFAEGAGSPPAPDEVPAADEERSITTEDPRRLVDTLPTNKWNSGKLHASSFSPMNALVESCAKYSEANSSMSLDDDVGMNLLASVAAGEMSRSDLVSPTGSTERSIPACERVCNGDEAKSKSSPEDNTAGVQGPFCNDAGYVENKKVFLDDCSRSENGLNMSKYPPNESSGDKKCDPSHTSEDILVGEPYKPFDSSDRCLKNQADCKMESSDKLYQKSTSFILPIAADKVIDDKLNEDHEKPTLRNVSNLGVSNCISDRMCVKMAEEKTGSDLLGDGDKVNAEAASSHQFGDGELKNNLVEQPNMGTSSQQKPISALVKDEVAESHAPASEVSDEVKVGEPCENDVKGCLKKSGAPNFDRVVNRNIAGESHSVAGLCCTSRDVRNHHKEASGDDKDKVDHISVSMGCDEVQVQAELRGSRSIFSQPDEATECATEASSSSATRASDTDVKMKFDLNEGLGFDDGKYGDPVNLSSSCAKTFPVMNSSPFSGTPIPSGHSASITVAAAAKGPFVPPEDLLRSKGELGWKGSAATSAFRPAEPRKFMETPFGSTNVSSPDTSTSKHGRIALDFDLNVPDEKVLEELASRESALAINSTIDVVSTRATLLNEASSSLPVRGSGGLDFDLNSIDETNENGQFLTSSKRKLEVPVVNVKPIGGLPTGDMRRDFDLNDGPGVDENCTEQFPVNQQMKDGIPSQLSSVGLRMNSPGLGSFSSWFMPGNTYSTVAIPSMLPDRGEQRFPVFPPNAHQRQFIPPGVNPFTSDIYRGSVLSSSPAMPLQSSPFQFPVFPFGATFPLQSATFSVGATSYADSASGPRLFTPPANPQLLGPVASVQSQFQSPYKVNLSDIRSNDGMENHRKWGRQGLDLNSGPGALETEAREEMLPSSSGQHSFATSQAIAEEHARMFSVSGGILKRKDPEGSWENENFRYRQSSWQ